MCMQFISDRKWNRVAAAAIFLARPEALVIATIEHFHRIKISYPFKKNGAIMIFTFRCLENNRLRIRARIFSRQQWHIK